MGYQLARGRPDSHCFGQLHSKPIGPATVVRNTVLLLLAIGVAAYPAPSWTSGLAGIGAIAGLEAVIIATILLLTALVAAEGWMLLNLARQQGRLLLRLDAIESQLNGKTAPANKQSSPPLGLRVGTPAPPFELPSLDGPTVSLDELRGPGRPVLLVSTDPGCGPCASLLPELAEWQRLHAGALTVAVLTRGSVEANHRKIGSLGVSRVLLQKRQEVSEQYQTLATPSAVLVDADGRIAAPVAGGADDIRRLVQRTVNPVQRRPEGVQSGAPRHRLRYGIWMEFPSIFRPGRGGPRCFCSGIQAAGSAGGWGAGAMEPRVPHRPS